MHWILFVVVIGLTGCAGSPVRNLLAGNGLRCTMAECGGERENSVRALSPSQQVMVDVMQRHSQQNQPERKADVTRMKEIYAAWVVANTPATKVVLPANYQDKVKTTMMDVLVDPWSAHYRYWNTTTEHDVLTKPAPNQYPDCKKDQIFVADGSLASDVCMPNEPYAVVPIAVAYVQVNSKNRMGGYAGWSTFRCSFGRKDISSTTLPVCISK